MNLLDMKTVIISYMITNVICALVMTMLWVQHRRRFDGLGFWLADFVAQVIALILVILRGVVPDFISMTVSNALGIGGTMLLLAGLERFWGKRRSQTHNAVLLTIFIVTHTYFVFVYPSLEVRNIVFSLGLLAICSQCAWFMLRGVDIEMRHHTRNAGILFVAYCLVSIFRILVDIAIPADNDFFRSNVYDASALMLYQMLSIMLVFSLFMMVNRRLVMDLEVDITAREQTENALRLSDEKFQKAFHSSPDAVLITRVNDGQIVEVNEGFCHITEYSREEALGHSTLTLGLWANPKDRESFVSALREQSRIRGAEYDFRAKSGKIVNGLMSAEIIQLDDMSHIMAVIHDLTERKQTDETFQIRLKLFELSSSCSLEELMQKALDEISPIVNSPIGFYHFVKADQKTLSLQAWSTRTLTEFCKAEGKGMHYPVDQAGVWTDCIIERKPVIHNDYPALPHRKGLPPGHAEVVRELVVPILRNGHVVSILGVGNKPSEYTEKDVHFVSYIADVIWEIVERKRAQEKLQQLSRAVEQSPASIVITDTAGKIEYVNPRFTEVTGYSAGEAIGKNPRILKTSKTPRETHLELWQALTSGREWKGEFVNRKKNGEEYYEYANISPILDDLGIVTHYLAVKEDITPQKMAEKELRNKNQVLQFQLETIQQLQDELREQAIRDPLTGLYNRRFLYETMGRELARARREKYTISFMMMDIDRFKQVNDTHGHAAGDMVLVALADLFRTHTRQGDIVCRYGGEEFLVVMAEVGEVDAKRRAEEIRHNFTTLRIDYNGDKISATISIGIAFYPRDGGDSDTVIKAADTAMYKAKQAGRNCVRVWESESQS